MFGRLKITLGNHCVGSKKINQVFIEQSIEYLFNKDAAKSSTFTGICRPSLFKLPILLHIL